MDQALKEYELVYIISPRVAADTIVSVIERVSGLISGGGGEVLSTDNWGRRRLAYPIKRFFEGTYVVHTLRMPAANAKSLESALDISEEVLRYLLTSGIVPPATRSSRERRDEERERPAESRAPAAAAAIPDATAATAEPVAATDTPRDEVPEPAAAVAAAEA